METLQILQQISSILNFRFFLFYYGLWLSDAHKLIVNRKLKRKSLPTPKCFRSNNYLFNLRKPTRDDYIAHLIIVCKPIIHIYMDLTPFTLETVETYSAIHVMEKDLIQIWRHMCEYKIIIILVNESPYISTAVWSFENIFFELR